jgi:hypothetical protein
MRLEKGTVNHRISGQYSGKKISLERISGKIIRVLAVKKPPAGYEEGA